MEHFELRVVHQETAHHEKPGLIVAIRFIEQNLQRTSGYCNLQVKFKFHHATKSSITCLLTFSSCGRNGRRRTVFLVNA